MAAYEKASKETHTKAKTDGKTPGKLLRLFALYENLTRFVMPLCTALTDREYPRTPITQSNNIVDISGVGLKQFWNLRGHMQDASTLATAHYPETLDRIFVSHYCSSTHLSHILTKDSRSSAHPPSSPPSGAGSRNGSTPSPPPRSSSCRIPTCNPPSAISSTQ